MTLSETQHQYDLPDLSSVCHLGQSTIKGARLCSMLYNLNLYNATKLEVGFKQCDIHKEENINISWSRCSLN